MQKNAEFFLVHLMYISGASSIMVARGALWNASIFSAKGKLPWDDIKREYVRKVFILNASNFMFLF